MPVVPGETYHYRLQDSAHITHTVRVDSSKTVGGDSVFYLNRVLAWPEIGGEHIALYKQGQFLGKTMTQKPDGRLVFEAENFIFDTSIVVISTAQLGASWLAVVDGNVTASVTSIVEGEVLGISDSLKTIQFSNGAEWVLSKNHGLLSIPDFNAGNAIATLSGLESQGLGDRLYRFEDFFDFNVGDVFEYRTDSETFTGSTGSWIKFTFLEKQIASSDTFQYLVERWSKTEQSGLFNGITYAHEFPKIQFFRRDFKNAESYNRQIIIPFSNPERFSFANHFDQGIYLGNRFYASDVSVFCSALSIPEDPNNPSFFIDDALDCDNAGVHFYYEEFRPKLGRVGYSVSMLDDQYSQWLRGAVIQGDTFWGSVTPDWYFTETSEPKALAASLKIYPNPATDLATLDIGRPLGSAIVQIFRPDNQLVRSLEINQADSNVQVDLSGLSTGIYFVVLRSENAIWQARLLKSAE